jgi:prepilin-type N-terminal cleavage/methylation domain-containing protein
MKQFLIKEQGFTLIEILISMFIFCAILGLIFYFGFNISGFNSFISSNLYSQNELELTLNVMVTEIRSMGPSNVGSYPIESASANSLIFFSDTDQDGLLERIRYFMSGNTFMKAVTKPTGSPLTYNPTNEKTTEAVHDVTSDPTTIFSYYAKKAIVGDTPMSSPISISQIRSIRISMTTDKDVNTEPGPVTFNVFSTIRNMRTNQ